VNFFLGLPVVASLEQPNLADSVLPCQRGPHGV